MSNVLPLQRPGEPAGTVVCIHGSAGSGRQWQSLAARMDERLQVVTPDLLGCGAGAGWVTGVPASLAAEVARLAPLLEATTGRVHVLGHSYGGAVAIELALRFPDRVASLTVYEPARFALLTRAAVALAGAEQIVSVGRRVQMLVLSGRRHEAAAFFVDYWSGDGAWAALPADKQAGVARRMPKVQAEFEAAFSDATTDAAIAALRMPVHLIGGSRSPLPVRQILDRLAALLPQATRSTVDGAGHMAPVTDAGAVAPHLPPWLRRVDDRLAA